VRERAGVVDRSERGKIEVTGKDRATFIHSLVSNDVKGLVPGQGREAALLDVHGKITALLVVHCLPDRLVLETDRQLAEPLASTIDRYLFSERAELEDVTGAHGILTVVGPGARKAAEQALGAPVPDLERWQHVVVPREDGPVRVVRGDATGEEEYDLWAPVAALPALWERLGEAGARPVGRDALEMLRVEAGHVRYGVDVDASTLLLEAPLADAFSLNKGCYLGQEVVARVTYRGHVNRRIVGFRFADARVPPPGASVKVGEATVGRITSAAFSPGLGVAVALGLVRREHQEPGTRVEVAADPAGASAALPAEVAALPLYRRPPAP
jgi:folate-binding protein YgfZ